MTCFPKLFKHRAPSHFGTQVVPEAYWRLPAEGLMTQLRSGAHGLSKRQAADRLKQYGPNALKAMKRATTISLFARPVQESAGSDSDRGRDYFRRRGGVARRGIVLAVVLGSTMLGLRAGVHGQQRDREAALEGHHPVQRAARRAAARSCPPTGRAGRRGPAVGGQPDPGRWRRARGQGLLRQPGGAHRRNLSGREEARHVAGQTPAWRSAATACSWAPACAAARRAR